jgi:hypothetical protein
MRLILIAVLLGVALATRVSYDGYKVLRLNPTQEQWKLLQRFRNRPGFDFWQEPRRPGGNLDIMVSPNKLPSFLAYLHATRVSYNIINQNVQTLVDAEIKHQETAQKTPRAISFDQYYRYDAINAYLQELAVNYPQLVTLETIGKSYEGRDMIVLKISSGGGGTRPVVLVDGGIHAREWVAPGMALYIIYQLVENSAANSNLTNGVDWYILPVLNPDGYEYSQTTDRMWRKSRSPPPSGTCYGVDQNRNWDFHWMENGASSNPCDETYAGQQAFSEVENRNLRDFALKYQSRIKLYLTFHTYGEYLLYPWGYTSALPSDWQTLQALAVAADAAQVAAGGNHFAIGTSTNVLYPAAGGSDDYMKGVLGIQLSYTAELTNTIYGFQLPASQLLGYVRQFFEAVRVFGTYVKDNFPAKA